MIAISFLKIALKLVKWFVSDGLSVSQGSRQHCSGLGKLIQDLDWQMCALKMKRYIKSMIQGIFISNILNPSETSETKINKAALSTKKLNRNFIIKYKNRMRIE
jgi:hypothetical protein